MGEEDAATGVADAVENGTTLLEKEDEVLTEKKEEKGGVKEMEEDWKEDEKTKSQKMDVDKEEVKETKKSEVEEEETEVKGSKEEKGKDEEEIGDEPNEESEEKVAELEVDKENPEGVEQGKGSKKRRKAKIVGEKVEKKKPVKGNKEQEQKTPVASAIERPVRERKSVERLVASFEIEAVKEFHIAKGRGTALKDIPNVAYKLSKRKTDDTFKLLHTILFGRRGKALQIKNNVSRFSGFVWHENEDKQKLKVKEKLDKCVKEKLLDICDVLDIPIAKATTKKEDIVAKLADFLVAPHATTIELLAEKEQSSKGKKRKRASKGSASRSGGTSSKGSDKSRKGVENSSKAKEKKGAPETDDELEEEERKEEPEEQETINGVPERSDDETPERAESEENEDQPMSESEEDTRKRKRGSKKSSTKKESIEKSKTKKITPPKKSSPAPKKTPVKSSSGHSKVKDNRDASPKISSRKKKNEVEIKKSSTPKKSASKEKIGKKVVRGKEKPKEDKLRPSDDELKSAICEVLKEVDFNTATFTDILKQLAKRFSTDLTPRKASIKLMIQDELTKLADGGDDDDEEEEDEEGDVEKDEKQLSGPGVEA